MPRPGARIVQHPVGSLSEFNARTAAATVVVALVMTILGVLPQTGREGHSSGGGDKLNRAAEAEALLKSIIDSSVLCTSNPTRTTAPQIE